MSQHIAAVVADHLVGIGSAISLLHRYGIGQCSFHLL